MAENKLLGKLQLDSSGVMKTIQDVDNALKNLGKGVDLNLTNILNAKVNTQLKSLRSEIENVSKAANNVGAAKGNTSIQNRINEMVGLSKAVKSAKESYDVFDKAELKMMENLQKQQAKYIQQQEKLDAKATINSIEQRMKAEAKAQQEAARIAEENARKMEKYQKQWATYVVSALGAASLSILKKQWTEAVNYAKNYYDALNEIRVVTGMTESQAMAMGQQMRDLAKEMKVTSTELSQAAITFYRQGLSDSEVQDRLKWVTEYAKVAHMEFNDAAELMTAAINTMGDSIQESGIENVVEHIADVWLYLGDSAATSGEEIGKAMQKASASATEFGLSFEWLGTYIAVVAEQTRQAPEAIGNAFNSMMARMHQIKAKGFNDEDTTKLNDVAKALATINVELLDSQGDWRDMNEIYEDIAAQWENMDAKQRGYIATTMAGTRQQNVFYALMNDMSKGLEGGSRAWELYTGVMNAAGTATEKYAVWQESIAASEANMQNSLEQLYSNLQPSLIKGFYDVIATLVGGLNNLGGVLPVVVSGVFGLATAIIAVKTGLVAANPLVAVMTAALGTLVSLGAMGIGGALGGGIVETTAERFEAATKQMADSEKRVASLQSASKDLATMFGEVQSGATLSKEELTKYSASLETISSISPTAEQAVKNLTSGFGDQATILQELSDKAQETIDKELALQKINAETALVNFQNSTEYTEAKSYSRDNYGWVKSGNYAAVASPSRYYDPLNYDNPLSNYLNGLIKTGILDRTNLTEVKAAVDNFFANYEKTLSDAVNKDAANVVNNVISALGQLVNSVQRMQLGEVILDMLAGEDGNLDYKDVAKERVTSIWGQLVKGAEEALDEGEGELEYLIQKIWDDFGLAIDELDWAHPMLETDEMGNPFYEIEKVNTATAELIYSLLSAGKAVDEIQEAFAGTQNLDEFIIKLQEFANAEEDVEEASGGVDKSVASIKNFIDSVDINEDKVYDIEKIKNALEVVEKGSDGTRESAIRVTEALKILRDFVSFDGIDKTEWLDKIREKLNAFDGGAFSLDEFKTIVEKAQEAKEALDKLTGDKELSPKDQAKNSKVLNEIFGEYNLAELEGTDEYITKATELYNKLKAAVLDEASYRGDYGKSVIKYFSDLAEELGDTELSGFIKKVEELQKVQDAFNLLTDDTQKKNATATQTTSAVETLAKAFEDLDVKSPTYIDDLRAKIAELTAEAESGAGAFGVLGKAIIDSMTGAKDDIVLLKNFVETDEEIRQKRGLGEVIDIFNTEFTGKWSTDWEEYFDKVYAAYLEIQKFYGLRNDDEALLGEYRERVVAQFKDDTTTANLDFETFKAVAQKAQEAKEALDKLTSNEELSPKVQENYYKTLNEIFGEYNLAALEGTDEYITKATDLYNRLKAAVMDEASFHGDYGKSVIKYFSDLADKLGDTELSGFIKKVEELQKVQDAFNLLTDDTQKKNATAAQTTSAVETLAKAFDDLDVNSPTYIEDVRAKIAELTGEVESGANAFGVLGQMIIDSMTRGADAVDKFKYAAADIAEAVIGSGNHDAIGSYMENVFGGGNVDLLNRKRITNADGTWSTLQSDVVARGNAVITITPMLPNGEVLSDEALSNYLNRLFASDNILEADKIENGGKGLVLFAEENVADIDAAVAKYQELALILHELQAAYYSDSDLNDFAKQAAEQIEDAKAATNDYKDELKSLSDAFNRSGPMAMAAEWAKLSDGIKNGIAKQFPSLLASINKVNKSLKDAREGRGTWADFSKAVTELENEFEDIQSLNASKYFEGTADAILGLKNGTVDVDAALEKFNSEQKKAIEVQQEYEAAVEKAGTKAELTTADVSKMAEAFNMTPQQILDMWSEIGPMMEEYGADMEAVRASLQKEIFLSLVGTSTADFSAIQEGLMSVENMAQSTIDTLIATGQFEVIRKWMEENAEYQTFDPATGEIITTRAETSGWVDVIVPKGGSVPTKPSGSGSKGGGGGGGNKNKETSAAMSALDRMSRVQKLQEHRRSLYSAQAGLYEQSGELQGVIAYNEKEIEVIEEQNETLEDNIKELEEWIAKKKEEMASLDQSSEEYTTAKDELEKLEDTHQEYTLALINNKKEVLSLRDAIKQLKNEIRDMQIEVYDEVVAALEARDAAEQERLEGAVAVQKSILEVMQEQEDLQNSILQGRANVESAILETIMAQKDKRQEERDAWLNFEQTVLGVIEEEKALRDSMNQGRIDAEQQVLETILATKELHDRMIDGRVDMENTVLEILKQQEEEVDSMREARISMEDTIMEMMKAKEAEEEKLLQARVSLENTILNLIKAQASVQQKMLTATINLENRISSVLKAQDTRQKNLLQARINAENTVFGLIKERYETEKEAALEAASAAQEGNQAQIDALQKQKDLLDEQLQLRKKQAEEQDKAVELAELEAKYARISADPTRMKEALEIRKQIDDLRDEMAWETAQKEIDAQKQAIDDQINALQGSDGGSSAINAYYEELFSHPTKLLAEMDEILKGTDDEIIEWLKTNSEEYTWASEANKKKMVEDWKDMLREMRGETEDYRDRVAEIMGLSDEEIIEWLKANDEEYLNASDNRRKQILESWNQTIREMRNEEISYNEEVARILGGSDEDILNWLAANDSSYANGTEAEQASKMKAWQKSLRELRGESENYLDEAHRIMTQSDDDIIAWLMENDKTYQEASDDRRQKIVEGWKETLDAMAGVTKDYRDVVNSILSGSADEIMAWLMNNDKAYALASDAEREQMTKGWQESLENMYGVTVNYWREIDLVLSGSEEQFVSYMKSHSLEYADASKTSQEEMVKGWQQTYRDMKGEATNYWDEINELANGGYEGYIEELKKRSTSYTTGSDEEKAQLLQEWTDVWEQMHGITKTYWDKVNEVIDGGLDNFLDFMKKNNLDYANASDAEKASSILGWTDMWREMEGSSKDYRDEVAAVMAQGHDAYIGYMTSMSKEYADATEEEKQTMLKSYEDMWDQMTGKQKSYEDEANAIIAQGQEAIISTLTEYTEKYQNVGKMQSDAYIEEWEEKLDKLKKALQEIAINTDVFDYTQPDEAGTTSGEDSAASEEANKMYWRAEANWQRTFESRREALDYKNQRIGELEAKLAQSPNDENILSKLETWRSTPILYYARGGIADFTGPAWLDGSKRSPERILSPRQTELFDLLVSSLEDISVHVPSFPSFNWERGDTMDGGFSFGDIVINVDHLDSDTDYEDMAERVLDSVMQKINRGNVVGGIRFSK